MSSLIMDFVPWYLTPLLCLFNFSQSYALYIGGDPNATSSDVVKYLAKVPSGACGAFDSLRWPLTSSVICSLATMCKTMRTKRYHCSTWSLIDKHPLVAGRSQRTSGTWGLDNAERKMPGDAGSRVTSSACFVVGEQKTKQQCVLLKALHTNTELVIDSVGSVCDSRVNICPAQ